MLWKYRKSLPLIIALALDAGLQMAGVEIKWLGYLLIAIAILGMIYFICGLIREKQLSQEQSNQANLVIEHSQTSTSDVLHIERLEPSNRPPFWFVLIGMLAFLVLLAFGIFQTYLVVSGIVVAKLNLEWIVFYLLFGVFPIWILLDILVFDRKHYKSGRSATAIDATFIVKGDITDVFNRCSNILETMEPNIIRKDTPNLIKAHLNKSRISIEVSPQDDNVKVYVLSDATWVTVKAGKGRNQRIIDEFQKHFLEEFRAPYKQRDEVRHALEELSQTPLVVECNSYERRLVGETWLKEKQYIWFLNVILTNQSDTQNVSTKAVSLEANIPIADGGVRGYVLSLVPDIDKTKYGHPSTASGEPLTENKYLHPRESLRGFYQFLDEDTFWKSKSLQIWPTLVVVDSFGTSHRSEFPRPQFAVQSNSDKEGSKTE